MGRRWLCSGLVVSVAVGLLGFVNDSERVTIGAHAARSRRPSTVTRPSTSAPFCRGCGCRPTCPAGLGVNVDVQETDADNLTDLLNRDALIASPARR